MVDLLSKIFLCVCLLFAGNGAFASVLSNVEVSLDNKIGKIILDTDKSAIYKKVLSNDKIHIKLKNTTINDNIKILYNSVPKNMEVSIMQNGKDAYISLFGENIAKYELLFAHNESIIPIKNGLKDFFTYLFIISLVLITGFISKKIYKSKMSNNLNSSDMDTVIRQKKQIMALNTIRNKSVTLKGKSIHGNLIANFAEYNKMNTVSVPENLQNSNAKYYEYNKNFKTAVNS